MGLDAKLSYRIRMLVIKQALSEELIIKSC